MSFSWGNNFKTTLFGESHGDCVGVIIEGLPPGFIPDIVHLTRQLKRRVAGAEGTTGRIETDIPYFLSGLFENHTTLAPLCITFRNNDIDSKAYSPLKKIMRPGHADYPAYVKSQGYHDYRGGGSFSARLTAPLVAAGSLARQLLHTKNITIGSHITTIGLIKAPLWLYPSPTVNEINALSQQAFPVEDQKIKDQMEEAISTATAEGDSLGGVIELGIIGLPVGLGEPFFNSLEANISHILFAVPSVKAVEFGDGLALASQKGSFSNDALFYHHGKVVTQSNHQGGINGGLTNGSPVIVRTTLRPAASIKKNQHTVNVYSRENSPLKIEGRHDSCPTKRAAVVLESALAIAIADMVLHGYHG